MFLKSLKRVLPVSPCTLLFHYGLTLSEATTIFNHQNPAPILAEKQVLSKIACMASEKMTN